MRRWHRRPPPAARFPLAIGLVVSAASISTAAAHEGPPFPILMDQPAEDYLVSVWADPDIGEALFYVVIESPGGGPPAKPPQAVSMWTEPTSGRLDRATYQAERPSLRNQVQFEARPYFDQRDTWKVGFRVVASGGRTVEFTTEVESTPPGYGAWDLVVYLFPFVLLAGLWAVAMIRRYRARSRESDRVPPSEEHEELNGADAAGVRATSGTAARPDPAWTSKHAGE